MYNHAQQGAFNVPQDATPKPTIVFDDEVKEILQKTYPEMINGMINLAIKRFAETKEFKDYFAKKEYRETIEPKETYDEQQVTAEPAPVTPEPSQTTSQQNSAISAISAW